MTLNHNYGCFSGVGSDIAGNYLLTVYLLYSNILNINHLKYDSTSQFHS